MAISFNSWANTLVTAPGATSSSSASGAYVSGRSYVVFVTQMRTDSIQPSSPTVSGLGVAVDGWTNFSGTENWDVDGASRRRTTVFGGTALTSGTGALTVSYASAPADIDICVVEVIGAQGGVGLVGALADGEGTLNADTEAQLVTMPGTPSSTSRYLGFFVMNIQAAASRFQSDWTTLSVASTPNSPTGTYFAGHGAVSDQTISVFNSSTTFNGSYYCIVLQVEEAAAAVPSSYVGILGSSAGTPPVEDPVSDLLVPLSGAWFGATTAAVGVQTESSSTGLSDWVRDIGSRPHILAFYKSGTWGGSLSATERTMCDPVNGPHAIPFIHMKFNSGNASWAQVAAGARDSDIDNFMAGIKTYPNKVMLSIFHEPEDNVGGSGSGNTAADYRAMWARVRARADAANVTNVVWVMQYMGYAGWAGSSTGSGFSALMPTGGVDWIAWDPYTWTQSIDTFEELVNATIGGPSGYTGFLNWVRANYPGVPLMMGEFATGLTRGQPGLTLSQAVACVQQWTTVVDDYPDIKAMCWWNSVTPDRDFQVQNRPTLIDAVTDLVNLPHFDNDPDLAV